MMARPDHHLLRSLPDGPPEMTPEGGIGIQSHTIGELVAAQAEANKEIRNVTASSTNPHYGNTFANLDSVTKTVRPIYARHGLTLTQAPWFFDGNDFLITTLAHTSGQWQRSCMRLHHEAGKNGMQAVGSSITYARRQALCGMANISQTDDPEDDDGMEASLPPTPAAPAAIRNEDVDALLDDVLGPPFPQTEDETKLFNAIDAISSMDSMRMFSTSPEMQQLRGSVRREVWIGAWDAKKKEIIDGNR